MVPLLIKEEQSRSAIELLRADPSMTVWWATSVECVSSLARREREGEATPAATAAALDRLSQLEAAWEEVPCGARVRASANRILRTHQLRADDALQLAAATSIAEGAPGSLEFVTFDRRLADAAAREGFRLTLQ